MARSTNIPPNQKTHGHAWPPTPEYRVWSGMKARCYTKSDTSYQRYGARGIRVCDRWDRFENFLADMGIRPSAEHSLNRKDNDGNYEPSNCEWATLVTQSRNKGNTLFVEFEGKRVSAPDLAERFGMTSNKLRKRLRRGWSVERAARG